MLFFALLFESAKFCNDFVKLMIKYRQFTIKPFCVFNIEISYPFAVLKMTLCFCCRTASMVIEIDLIKKMLPSISFSNIGRNT